jgi:hypothetical protein
LTGVIIVQPLTFALMKAFFIVVCTLLSVCCSAQSSVKSTSISGPITTKRGVVLREGDVLRLGDGSLPSRWFKYIFTSINGFDTEKARLDEGYAFNYATIKEFREVNTRNGVKLVALVKPKGGISVYNKAVDLEPAMDAKEVIAVNGVAVYKLIKAAAARKEGQKL